MAYATPEQLVARFDARVIGQLVDDSGVEITSLAANNYVLEALDDASGQIRSAALVANKYTETNLDDLAADNDPFLVRLTCTLAYGFLRNRRGMGTENLPEVERAENWLAALRLGERIFNIQDNADAGNVHYSTISLAQRRETNLLADSYRFYPVRRRYS